MAKQVINIGQTANDSTGDPLRSAFDKINDNFTELYDDDAGDVGSIIAGTDISVDQATGNVTVTNTAPDQTVTLTEGANVTITGTYPNFTIASDDVVGSVTSVNGQTGVAVLDTADISEDTNLYYTEARVSANTDVAANTAKTGITTQQASDITANNAKVSDQTVTLTEGTNVTITGTYPDFTIASDDVVGAVNSVNGQTGVVTLDSADISEDTNLYYTEARVSANSAVTLNTAKTGITSSQASAITTNSSKVGITSSQASAITANTAKTGITSSQASAIVTNTNKTSFPGFGTTSGTSLQGNTALLALGTSSSTALAGNTTTISGAQASAISANTSKTGITSSQASAITANTAKTGITSGQASAITANTSKVSNATHTGAVTGDVALTITNDAVTFDKLGVEYTTSTALTSASAITVNTALSDVFTFTAGHSATLNFTNVGIGDLKSFVITGGGGSYTLAFGTSNAASATYNKISGDFLDTSAAKNLVQIKFVAVNEAWYSISQIAS
tara:strand:- start:1431 stop:2954 length:1524 start_codon:yes stop_codon:yes gene_type:complete